MRFIAYVVSIVVGVIFGLWFGGSFIVYRITLNGIPISQFSAEQISSALSENSGALEESSHLIVAGSEILSVSGSWFMILAMLIAGSIPIIICYCIIRLSKVRRAGETRD